MQYKNTCIFLKWEVVLAAGTQQRIIVKSFWGTTETKVSKLKSLLLLSMHSVKDLYIFI